MVSLTNQVHYLSANGWHFHQPEMGKREEQCKLGQTENLEEVLTYDPGFFVDSHNDETQIAANLSFWAGQGQAPRDENTLLAAFPHFQPVLIAI